MVHEKELRSLSGQQAPEFHISSGFGETTYSFPWMRHGNVWIKGYIYHENLLLEGRQAAEFFRGSRSADSFINSMKKANGYFAVIVETPDFVYAGVDRVCSTPLLYRCGNSLEIGDNYKGFISPGCTTDQTAVQQVLASGYTYGVNTILEGVRQIPAGGVLVFDKSTGEQNVTQYYRYLQNDRPRPDSTDSFLSDLHEVHLSIFERMVNSLEGRQAIVPLSGGYDSRLIVEMLARFGHRDVLCVTWGKEDFWEVKVAQNVAQSLGMDWVRIENTREQWGNWYNSGKFDQCLELCGAIASIPYIQDAVLIEKLQKEGLIKNNAVFISGNSGDFIEGGHAIARNDPEEIVDAIQKQHMRLAELKCPDEIVDIVRQELSEFKSERGTVEGFDEYWEWKERQSKFVTKCVKAFEQEGYEWRMPFWDLELLEFWASVPRSLKGGRQLFYKYAGKYMNSGILQANPKVGFIRRYLDQFVNGRYGCYLAGKPYFWGLFSSNAKISGRSFSHLMRHRPIILTRINGLIALDTCGRIFEAVRTSDDG